LKTDLEVGVTILLNQGPFGTVPLLMNDDTRRSPTNSRTPHLSSATPNQKRKLSLLSAQGRHCPTVSLRGACTASCAGNEAIPGPRRESPLPLPPSPRGKRKGEGKPNTKTNALVVLSVLGVLYVLAFPAPAWPCTPSL
jgi:hypothetical protein